MHNLDWDSQGTIWHDRSPAVTGTFSVDDSGPMFWHCPASHKSVLDTDHDADIDCVSSPKIYNCKLDELNMSCLLPMLLFIRDDE